jgi:hypothetical protein
MKQHQLLLDQQKQREQQQQQLQQQQFLQRQHLLAEQVTGTISACLHSMSVSCPLKQ